MASEWTTIQLGEVATVRSGYAFKSADWKDQGIPVVKIANVKGGYLEMSGCSFVSESTAAESGEFQLSHGDILIAMTGYIGDVARVRKTDLPCVLNQRVGKFTVRDKERLDPDFLYTFLAWAETRQTIEALGYGSAQPNVSPSLIHKVELPLPPLAEQKAIAAVLGALDDKIELNRRMNATLEAMARALFQSWFVDFDPVRAKQEGRKPTGMDDATAALFPDSFRESELGEIPDGWEVVSLETLASIRGGKQLPTEACLPVGSGTFKVYGANGIMGCAASSTHDGFVIAFGRVGAYCGSIHWSLNGAWINNNASAVVPFEWPTYTLQSMLNIDFNSMRTGSAQPFIPNGSLALARVLRPTRPIADAFCRIVEPLRRLQADNEEQSRTLATLRDTLLPKLLSGELRVLDAERAVSVVA